MAPSGPDDLCEKLSNLLAKIISDKLKPALSELFINAEVGKNVSLDMSKLAAVVFPGIEHDAVDFAFKYDKDFVTKVDGNYKKIGALQDDIQQIRNKLKVCTRKAESNRKDNTKLKDSLSYIEDELNKFRRSDDYCSTLTSSNPNKRNGVGVAVSGVEFDVDPRSKSVPIDDKITSLEQSTALAVCNNMREMKACVKALEDKFNSYSNKLDSETEHLYNLADAQNQYGRRNILDINGVPWTRFENTNEIALHIFRSMGIRVNLRDIDRSHRVFHKNNRNSPPVIYVKLINHDLKQLIYDQRDKLRFMPGFRSVYIDENLTTVRRKLFQRARKIPHWDSWTNDGKIYLSSKNSKSRITEVITCEQDLRSFYDIYF